MSRKEERPSRNYLLKRVFAICVHRNIIYNVVFCEESLEIMSIAFGNGPAHELYCLKACQREAHVCFHEIPNEPCTSSKYDTKIRVPLDYL